MIQTHNGGRAAVATEFDMHSTTRSQRAAIVAQEERARAYTRTLPKRRTPEHERAGPVHWITF
jgi:hypothetical protein